MAKKKKKKEKPKYTSNPGGLKITRSGRKYTFKWNAGSSYTDINLTYSYKVASGAVTKSNEKSLSGSKRDYTVTISAEELTAVSFQIQAKARDKKWSAWVRYAMEINAPAAPTLEAEWDSEHINVTTFTYSYKTAEDAPAEKIYWETVKKYDCPEDYKKISDWKNPDDHGSKTAKEGTVPIAAEGSLDSSFARLVRVRAYGQGGYSKWVYAYHVYAQPNKPEILDSWMGYNDYRHEADAFIEWDVSNPVMQHPVDEFVIQTLSGVPGAGWALPTGVNWDDQVTRQYADENVWSGTVPMELDDDECVWYRVDARHDAMHNASDSKIWYGHLAKPTGLSINPVSATHTIEVTVTNASTAPDADLALLYWDPDTGDESVLGIIPHGTATPVNMVVPAWTDSAGSVGAYAFIGTSTLKETHTDGVKIYAVNPKMVSAQTWADAVATPTLTIERYDDTTALATWAWAEETADALELSWSDKPTTWDGTEEPSTHVIKNSRAAQCYVNNLEGGKKWYFRARFRFGDDENAVYGVYTATQTLDLTEAPNVPVLQLTDEIIPADGSVTASWTYTDSSPQVSAKIAEIIAGEDEPADLAVVAEDTSVELKAEDCGWQTGTQHQLVLQIWNKEERASGWSQPVTVTIADDLTCEITASSLVNKDVEIDPETYTGNPAVFNGGDAENIRDITRCEVGITPVQAGTPWQSMTDDTTVYNYRSMPSNQHSFNSEFLSMVVGATVCENQLVQNGDFADATDWVSTNRGSISVSDNTMKWTCSSTPSAWYATGFAQLSKPMSIPPSHKIFMSASIKSSVATVVGLYAMTNNGNEHLLNVNKSVTASTWTTVCGIIDNYKPTDAKRGKICYTQAAHSAGAITSGVTLEAKDFIIVDLTQWFGSAVADRIYAVEQAHAGDGVALAHALGVPSSYFAYNTGTLMSVEATAHKTYDNNNTLIQSYALDSSLTLRGLLKLDANNNIYADGDEYDYTGAVTRNYGTRAYQSGDESLANAITDGTDTVYKLNTATTDEADPFTFVQSVQAGGYEEFDGIGVPAGQFSWLADVYPITGTSTADAFVRGTNQWDEQWEVGQINQTTGQNASGTNRIRSKNYIPCLSDTAYYFTYPQTAHLSTGDLMILYYDAGKNYIRQSGWRGDNTFTTLSNAKYMRFFTNGQYGTTYNNDISINYPSTDHNYHAYNGAQYTQALGSTIYGGAYDFVSGKLTDSMDYIASYNGEAITTPWVSSYDAYASGATPTAGAQVCYPKAEPVVTDKTPQTVSAYAGLNYVSTTSEQMTVRTADIAYGATVLDVLPLTLTVSGAGLTNEVTASVIRTKNYYMERPDERADRGFAGEVVAQVKRSGDGQLSITLDDLIGGGRFDDTAEYELVASISDDLGRRAEDRIPFVVSWLQQAVEADAETEDIGGAIALYVYKPQGAEDTDRVDIYRLSSNKPQLIVQGAEFGSVWVDPFPTIGTTGGYRFCLVTKNGDYITEDYEPSWLDLEAGINGITHLIDFDGETLELMLNASNDEDSTKAFKRTRYLGGSIQGDFLESVEVNGEISGELVLDKDGDQYGVLRDLMDYSGVCHIRTLAGANYTGNVDVKDHYTYNSPGHPHTITLATAKVDDPQLDGVPLANWIVDNA